MYGFYQDASMTLARALEIPIFVAQGIAERRE
jgi:hypothetical protein